MEDKEIKIKKSGDNETPAMPHWAGFDLPFLGFHYVDMNPFSVMKRFTETLGRSFFPPGPFWAPAIEVREENGKLKILADLPGIKKSDVKVRVTDDAIIVEGERRHEKKESHEGIYHSERSYGHFYRSIPLPKDSETENATAEYTDGTLEVIVPIPESKSTTRDVPVKHAA